MHLADTVPIKQLQCSWWGSWDGAECIKDGMRQVRTAQIASCFVFVAAPDEMPKRFFRFCDMRGRMKGIHSLYLKHVPDDQ